MSETAESSQTPDERDLGVRALRALATAQLRQAQYELAQAHLLKAMERSEQLRSTQVTLGDELRETVASIAREELAAGQSAVHLVLLLHEIVNDAALDRQIRREVEFDVVRWGIEAYYAA